MNVAILELCKELYELSGWKETGDDFCVSSTCRHHGHYVEGVWQCPAYDCGYLLRRLPPHTKLELNGVTNQWQVTPNKPDLRSRDIVYAATPEDALCISAIELFKQGILTNNLKG